MAYVPYIHTYNLASSPDLSYLMNTANHHYAVNNFPASDEVIEDSDPLRLVLPCEVCPVFICFYHSELILLASLP